MTFDLSRAEADVLAERRRQVAEEGWTAEHDDEHGGGQLALAASCYALPASRRWLQVCSGERRILDIVWPWDRRWWKPKTRRFDLVRSAALLIAEIERLDRASVVVRGSRPRSPKFPDNRPRFLSGRRIQAGKSERVE